MQYESYLSHHGVDGQQWGIKNGPPYPLDARGRRALRKQKKQTKKSLVKAVAAESLNTGLMTTVVFRMTAAKTKEEYKSLEKEFDALAKQHKTLHKNTQEKASELLKMNAGKNIKYANYELYTMYNAPAIKSTKNTIENYMLLRKKYKLKRADDQHDIVKNGKNIISQYINSENLHNG